MASNRKIRTVGEQIAEAGTAARDLFLKLYRPVLACCLCAVAVAAMYFAVDHIARTGRFLLDTVEVTGNTILDPVEVAELCGLEPGFTNVFMADEREIESRCTQDDRILYADVRKMLPDKLSIRIREARPAIFVQASDGLKAFDEHGQRFWHVPQEWSAGLPILVGARDLLEPVLIEPRPFETKKQKKTRMEIERYRDLENRREVSEVVYGASSLLAAVEAGYPSWIERGVVIEYDGALGFTVVVPGRPEVAFGFKSFNAKVKMLAGMFGAVASTRKNIVADRIYLDNDDEPSVATLRARVSKQSPGTALSSVVTFE